MAPPPPLLQFLNNVLSQRGPNSLPYPEDVKWLIRQHLVALIETYPSLQPKTATFTHNDGTTANLLQADGTIPMVYQNVTYNIPIIVWLMESYPRQPPCVYVAPTRDMIIKRPHPFVNPSGLVAIGYLQHWVYPSSNLVDMVRELGVLFGRDPPLYTRQQAQSPRPNPPEPRPSPNPTTPAIPPRVYSTLGSPYGSGGGSGRFPPSPQRQSHSHSHSHSHSQSTMTDDPNEVFKRNAINKLTESLATDIAALGKARAAEMEGLLSLQQTLRQREEEISKGMREMNEEKEGLEQQLQMVLMNEDILEAWLRDNEGKVAGRKANVDAEEVFESMDPLSKQMLECTSSDLAIEDVIYELDKAVQRGCIPFDQYLKQIRSLSREQFFQRATAAKVRAAQMRY